MEELAEQKPIEAREKGDESRIGVAREDRTAHNVDELDVIGDEPLDVAAFINDRFPNEEALDTGLDVFLAKLRAALTSLNSELEEIVRIERHGGAKSAREVASAVEQLKTLKSSVSKVTASAAQAESAVEQATRDIKPLDVARRNLLETAEALRNLVALEDAITKLEQAVHAKVIAQIAACSHLLSDVARILERFASLPDGGGLKRLVEMRQRAAEVRKSLRVIVLDEFEELSRKVTTRENYDIATMRLKSACQVVDDLGETIRVEVVGHYVGARHAAYDAAFADSGSRSLSSLDKRFAWLRRERRVHEEKGVGSIFPPKWRVSRRICEVICDAISNFINMKLSKSSKEVHSMVLALQRTVEFETELQEHYKDDGGQSISFVGIMSTCFEPYMSAFVTDEDESLTELLNDVLRSETWVSTSAANVLKSSTDLFLHIQKSTRRCAQLTTSRTFFNMHKVYKKQLFAYCNAISRRIPPKEVVPATAEAETSEERTKWENEAKRLCAILSTAMVSAVFRELHHQDTESALGQLQYCANTTEQLEESLKKQIDASFEAEISMRSEVDQFISLSGKAMKSLVQLTSNRLEPALLTMTKANWSIVSSVGDSSLYLTSIEKVLRHAVPVIRGQASPTHYKAFCDHLVINFVGRFTASLYRCRQISAPGAQQLLLDTSVLKTILREAPRYGLDDAGSKSGASTTYASLVNREITKAEGVLKVILSAPESIVDTYIALFDGGSSANLQQLLELKGLKGKDAAEIMADYQRVMRATGLSLEGEASLQRATAQGAAESTSSAGANTVDSMKSLFGRLSTTFMDANLGDRLQISETAADMLKRGLGTR